MKEFGRVLEFVAICVWLWVIAERLQAIADKL